MGWYHLSQIWPYLRILSFLGVFPVIKVEENGIVTFKPMHVCSVLARWIFFSFIMSFGLAFLTMYYAMSKMGNMTYVELLDGMFNSMSLTQTDALTTWTSVGVYYLASILVLWRNFVLSRTLDDYLRIFEPVRHILQGSQYKRKTTSDVLIWTFMLVVLTMVSYFAMYIGMLLRLANTTDWSVVSGLIVASLGNLPTSVYQMTPLFAFYLVFGDICMSLAAWAHDLVKLARLIRQKPSHGGHAEFFTSCSQFVTAFKTSSSTFSLHLFYLILLTWGAVTATSYRTVAFFIGNFTRDWIFAIIAFGYFGLTLLLSIFLAFVCQAVAEILAKVDDLAHEVVGLHDGMDELLLVTSGEGHAEVIPFSEAKERTVHYLTSLNGFSAQNYFTVNKELLTAIMSNFVTYLIILLQFRVGENSSTSNPTTNSTCTNDTISM